MFRKHKEEKVINKEIIDTKEEINKVDKLNVKISDSIPIKDLEIGKVYFKVSIGWQSFHIDKIMVARKSLSLPYNMNGWLVSYDPYYSIDYFFVNRYYFKYNGDKNSLLQSSHPESGDAPISELYSNGPIKSLSHYIEHDDPDSKTKVETFFLDSNVNLNKVKNEVLSCWENYTKQIREQKLKEYIKELDKELNSMKDDILKNFGEFEK